MLNVKHYIYIYVYVYIYVYIYVYVYMFTFLHVIYPIKGCDLPHTGL